MTRPRADALILVAVLAGGYLALAPRPASDAAVGIGPSQWSPARSGASDKPIAPLTAGGGQATAGTSSGGPSGAPLHLERNRHADPLPSPTRRIAKPTLSIATRVSGPLRPQGTQGGRGDLAGPMAVVRTGLASTYGPAFSERWVALPDGPGWRFRVCGPGGCRELVSSDAGPDLAMQRQGRIVDLPVGAFEAVCGVSWRMGLCNVSVTIEGRSR